MKKALTPVVTHIAMATLLALPLLAQAESTLNTASPGPTSTTAKLNFSVVVPRVLYLGVGSGGAAAPAALTANGTVDTVTFTVPAASLGNNVAIAGTGPAPVAGGVVPVRLVGNNGNIAVSFATTTLASGADTIPWTEIGASSSAATFQHTGTNLGTAGVTVPAAVNKVTNASANWTFNYRNTAAYAVGTYSGTVTYTATMP